MWNKTYFGVMIPVLIYGIYFGGLVLSEINNITVLIRRIRFRHRLSPKPEEGRLSIYFSNLLNSALGRNCDGVWMIVAESVIFLSCFIVCVRSFTIAASIVISVMTAAMPVLILYSRSLSRKSKGSLEGISVVSEIYRQYKIIGLNIYEAIEKTVESEGDFPISRKLLYILLIRLRDASGPSSVRQSCRRFGNSLGSVWGRMLSAAIEEAVINGTDISNALIDLTEQLKTAKNHAEERKRLNSEASRMTVFLIPVLYIASILISVKYLDLSVSDFIRNQFFTREGLIFFFINIFLFTLNIVILGVIGSTKMDL